MATINGNSKSNTLTGTAADDILNGLGGNDKLYGLTGHDTLNGGAGNDTLNGGEDGDTYLVGLGAGLDTYADSGTSGVDTILATADGVTIGINGKFAPSSGIEVIDAGGHTGVTVSGGAGSDTLDFSATTLIGISGISGGAGNDTIIGSAADDTIIGGAGNDKLNGGEGSDIYKVGVGGGIDTYADTGTAGVDTILATADKAVIGIKSGFNLASSGIEAIDAGGHAGVTITGGSSDDTFDFTGITLTGIAAINGNSGKDTIIGSGADDVINGGQGNDTVNGAEGSDTYKVGTGSGLDSYGDTGTSGTDTIIATADKVAIGLRTAFGASSGIEVIDSGGYSGVIVTGGRANESLDFSTVTLKGIASINGDSGDDSIVGSAGDDKIIGGAGNDSVTGGGGADLFVYASGNDKVTDFTQGSDHIDVSATGISDWAALLALGKQSGADTVFTFSAGNTLTLNGQLLANLTASDFGLTGNTPPVFSSGTSGSEAENTAATNVVYQAAVSDPDGGAAKFTLDKGGDNDLFSIDATTGEVRFLAAPDFENPADADKNNAYQIVIHANDGVNDVTKSVTIGVTDVNDVAPTFTSGTSGSEAENTAATNVVYQAAVTDADGGAAKFTLDKGGDNDLFSIDATTGEVRFLSAPDFENPADADKNNSYQIVIHANDGVNETTKSVTIGVTDVNDVAPTFTSGSSGSEAENTAATNVVYQAKVTDPDGGAAKFTLDKGGDNDLFSIDATTGEVRFLSTPDYENPADADKNNSYQIVIHANDGVNDTTKSVTIGVTDANDVAPTFTSGATGSEAENTAASSVVYQAKVTDPDGATTIFSLDKGGDNDLFSIDAATGEIRFLSAPDFENPADADKNNSYQVVVHANDGVHDVTKAITIGVTDVNDNAPVAVADKVITSNVTTSIPEWTLLANDTDADANTILQISGVSGASSGSLAAYTPTSSQSDLIKFTDTGATVGGSFQYTDSDGAFSSGNATVTVTRVTTTTLQGQAGSEILIGSSSDEQLNGGGGSNILLGAGGNDTIYADYGNGYVSTSTGNNTVDGGSGNDLIYGGLGNDTLDGGTGNDSVYGYSANGDNTQDGNDKITDTSGDNTLGGGYGNDTITGGSGIDTLYGDEGNDTLNGGDGDNWVYGGYGNDTITAGSGNDHIYADSASSDLDVDVVTAGAGDDTVNFDRVDVGDKADGGTGFDTLNIALDDGDNVFDATKQTAFTNFEVINVDGAGGNDTLTANENGATLWGNLGDDTLNGGGSGDNLYGGSGSNTIHGGGGNDQIFADYGNGYGSASTGDNTVDGGSGDDTIWGGLGNDTLDGGIGNDTIHGDSWSGDNSQDGSDKITDTSGDNQLFGGYGNDTITAGDGNDTLVGDVGNDTLNAGDGDNYVYGGYGNDVITAGSGNDYIYADSASSDLDVDVVKAGAGDDNVNFSRVDVGDKADGGAGWDTLNISLDDADNVFDATKQTAFTNFEVINVDGAGGNDTLTANDNGATLWGNLGDDTLNGGGSGDNLYGGSGSNTIHGGGGNDQIFADYGNGYGSASTGDNTVDGGSGDDTIWGGLGNDTLDGGIGNDTIHGDSWSGDNSQDGNDKITDTSGDNQLFGGYGNDTITAGDGSDYLVGDVGNDTLTAGNGDNTIYGGAGNDTITAGDGNDQIYTDDSTSNTDIDNVIAGGGDDVVYIYHLDSGDKADGGAGFDILNISLNDGDNTFNANTLTSFTNFEVINVNGLGGKDTITANDNGATLWGAAGNDTLNGGASADHLYGGTGSNTLNGNDGNDIIYADYDGASYPTTSSGNNTVNGGNGDDDIYGGLGNDTLNGGADNDVIHGDSAWGDNTQDGNDILIGGAGNDTLWGGAGNDTFRYTTISSGTDVIQDFTQGSDKIDLSQIDAKTSTSGTNDAFAFGGQNANTVANSVTWYYDSGNNQTVIQIDNNGNTTADLTITLVGAVTLTATDFTL
jgi:Ca2+-binding RTX toxin-like protein